MDKYSNVELAAILVMAYDMNEIVLLKRNEADPTTIKLHFCRLQKPNWEMDNGNPKTIRENFDSLILNGAILFAPFIPELHRFRYKDGAPERALSYLQLHHPNAVKTFMNSLADYFEWLERPGHEIDAAKFLLRLIISIALTKKFEEGHRKLLKKIEQYPSQGKLPKFLQLEIEGTKKGEGKSAIERKDNYIRFTSIERL